jgi:hypothetical protein
MFIPPVEAKRRSRYRGPACPVAPEDGTGVAPADGTGIKSESHLTGACPVKSESHLTGACPVGSENRTGAI